MKNIHIILIALISLSGCVTEKRCNSKYPPEVMIIRKDSIITKKETIFRDTTIFVKIPGENQYYTDTIYIKDGQLYFKPSHLRTSFAESRAWIENGNIRHTLTQNDTIISVRINNAIRLTWERAEKYYSKDQTKIVEKKVVPLWVKILSFVGAATLMYLIYKITRLLKL